jgi:hypothetical protein
MQASPPDNQPLVNPTWAGLIEVVERDAWLDLYAAASDEIARDLGLNSQRLREMAVFASREVPIVEFNRAICVGAVHPLTMTELDEALAWLQANAAGGWAFQISPLARSFVANQWLQRRAMKESRTAWAKFVWDAAQTERAVASRLDVRLVTAESAKAFGNVVQAGFGLPVATAEWFTALVGRPGWRLYLAYDSEIAVASGAVFVRHDVAWFGIDATLKAHRRRGAQTALINRRIEDGRAAGVAAFTAETGWPAAGEASAHGSFGNYLRAGFRVGYVRPNLKLA